MRMPDATGNKKGKAEAFPSGQRDIRLLVGGYGLLDELQELVRGVGAVFHLLQFILVNCLTHP